MRIRFSDWLEFFDLCDVQNGASDNAARNVVFVEVGADFEPVSGYKGRVMVGDVVAGAVGHSDFEWLERLCFHQFL